MHGKVRAGVIFLTAPQPAGACFILPVQRQSGAIKTAGSTPGPNRTTAPTHTLTNASLIHKSRDSQRQIWIDEPSRKKTLKCSEGGQEVTVGGNFLINIFSAFVFRWRSLWIISFYVKQHCLDK